ncbi:flagellin [Malikia spinosa]|uniref:Flagellin n=1 Tax=Malikia spinosa TaxID=86180 RepID=A0A7C9IYG0_9BURK|nr:flagellin [Malikia spinosa]MYZ52892.1 flagellin [Malikia spinosa]OGB69618.1 MAG: hypothetical protein A2486_14070 [Burkholderiales bacterium RIFOXYC12_FULL_65_23]
MASYINTNLSSMQAQRSLSTSQASLTTSIQRLSSGMRVNGAKDDAAGLAIATGMDKTVRGQTVAMRNANDAISFSQTTEGALGKIGDTLQRMRELSVQSANGTNSADQRGAMNTEFKQLQKEIGRVTENTEFNGIKVLGDGAKQTFQIGSGTSADNQIDINGTDLTLASSDVSKSINTGNGTALDADQKTAIGTYAAAIAADPTDATALSTLKTALAVPGTGADQSGSADEIVAAVKDFQAAGGAIAADGTVDTATSTASTAQADKFTAALKTEDGVNISTAAGASNAMDKIDAALKQINTEQTTQGAAQNRMSSVISTLQVSNENQTAARSRIMDTDFASETANLARSQILQQASTAMLGQANQLPNGVMRLLG